MTGKKEKLTVIITGLIVGLLGVLLVLAGNPKNMGFCIACFIRDTAGALGLHKAPPVMYIRPEIIGLVLGSFLIAIAKKEYKPRGGSAPFTRFILGFAVMVGALVFLGCPLRMVLRLAGGDLNALVGFGGFICGIIVGILFLNRGYSLKRTYTLPMSEGVAFPIVQIVLLVLLVAAPSFILFTKAGDGPGGAHAAVALSLGAGLLVGIMAQRSRFCMAGGVRDVILFKDFKLISGFIAVFAAALIANLLTKNFNPGFMNQPIAHSEHLWNFMGMLLLGLGSILLGGCPLRQVIMAGEGNIDSVITVLGYTVGAAFCHNFGLASSGEGTTLNGRVAVMVGIVICLIIGFVHTRKESLE
jgi:YedE family putative selenium metabolism protein